jgi:chaperonin GroES
VKVTPVNDFILVDTDTLAEEKTKGGILLPGTREEKARPSRGEVLAVGPGKYVNGILEPMRIKKGDKILFQQFPFFEFTDERDSCKRVILVRELQVVAVIE